MYKYNINTIQHNKMSKNNSTNNKSYSTQELCLTRQTAYQSSSSTTYNPKYSYDSLQYTSTGGSYGGGRSYGGGSYSGWSYGGGSYGGGSYGGGSYGGGSYGGGSYGKSK